MGLSNIGQENIGIVPAQARCLFGQHARVRPWCTHSAAPHHWKHWDKLCMETRGERVAPMIYPIESVLSNPSPIERLEAGKASSRQMHGRWTHLKTGPQRDKCVNHFQCELTDSWSLNVSFSVGLYKLDLWTRKLTSAVWLVRRTVNLWGDCGTGLGPGWRSIQCMTVQMFLRP